MKRFTSFMLMLLVAVTTWAFEPGDPVTDMSTLKEGDYVLIKNVGRNKYAYENPQNGWIANGDNATDVTYLWQVHLEEGGKFSFSSVMGGYIPTPIDGKAMYTVEATDAKKDEFTFSKHNEDNAKWKVQSTNDSGIYWDGQAAQFVGWYGNGANSRFDIILVEDPQDEVLEYLSGVFGAAKTELTNLAKVSEIFATAKDALEEINKEEVNTIDGYRAAIKNINTINNEIKKSADGKNVKLCNKANDARGGKYLGYDNTNKRAAAVASNGDDVIWTIKLNEDGTFKLYNFVNDLYLGTPADPTPTVATEADAPSFTIIPTDENVIAVVATTGQMVHVANHSNYKLISYYSLTDAASLWDVTAVPAIVATHDDIAAANAAKATLPYAIQQAYGLVTDANNYFSNYKSEAEGSYEALLDNVETTYFHSAYNKEPGDGTGVHYIQADLGEGNTIGAFYFYMKPRSGNGNNRPKNITVYGSNDLNVEFTQIAQITTTLDASMTPYMSPKLGDEMAKYRYIRLTVTSTNTGTKFFTLSELYFFPATEDVTKLANAYTNLASTSITSADYATYANALVNAESTLALANIKKEIASLLDVNKENYAEVPALGQYTTAGYNALNSAYTAIDATQESLEAAVVAFKRAKNSPVFTISGTMPYVVGKSLYEDEGNTNAKGNDCYFKTTNKYDKTMWWVFDQASTTVGVTESVAVVNYATGNPIWGVENLKITETDPEIADDGVFLFYSVGNNTPLHFQADGAVLCRYGSYTADSGSAATFTYVGNTYELDKMSDAHIDALADLQVAYNSKALYTNAVMGEGLGQYQGDKDAIVTALTAAEGIGSKTLAEQATLNIEDINAATTALNNIAALKLNMPEAGKYYYLKNGDVYLSCEYNGNQTLGVTSEPGLENIFYYEKDDNDDSTYLMSYKSGGYLANPWHIGVGEAIIQGTEKYKQPKTFVEGQVGKYALKYGNGNYIIINGNATYYSNASNAHLNENGQWTLVEVETLPVSISAAGKATFFAPVAVTIPEDVKAYTVTINGEWATLNEIEGGVIPANTGVVLAGEMGAYDFVITTTTATVDTDLEGTAAATYVADDAYVLGIVNDEVGFYTATKNQQSNTSWLNNSHKAYLPKPVGATAAYYSFRFGEGTTGIGEVKTENGEVKSIYDLTGRRVEAITAPGIYIINGKKTLVK